MNERKQKLISLSILIGIIIIAFALYMISLTSYSISYGPDGPYYDIQVREILETGFPDSNDAPLVYYYLTLFVLIFQDSYLGIKIGMSLIAALMAVPAYKLTKLFTKNKAGEDGGEKGLYGDIPAFLAAFLITTNVYVYRMLGDFMQNLFGVFFLLFFVYYAVNWFENPKDWKKNAPLMLIFFVCTFFSHVYPALLGSLLMGAIFLFNLTAKWIKTKKLPLIELVILITVLVFSVATIIGLAFLYPSTLDNITSRLSTYISDLTTGTTETNTSTWQNISMYLTVPYIWGVVVVGRELFNKLKQRRESPRDPVLNKKTLLCWMYLVLSTVLFLLSIIPTSYSDRIVLMAFIPVSLICPIAVYQFQKLDLKINWSHQRILTGVIAGVFIVSTLFSTISYMSSMGPYISMDEYYELEYIEQNYISTGIIDSSGVILVNQYHFGYWVEYTLDMDVDVATSVDPSDFEGVPVYIINRITTDASPFQAFMSNSWFPLTPFGFSSGSSNNPGSIPGPRDAVESSELQSNSVTVYSGYFYRIQLLYYANGTEA